MSNKQSNLSASISTPQEFTDLLYRMLIEPQQEADLLKYILYVRKSTEGEERQARSLADQVAECEELSQQLGLNVVKVYRESESAKDPDIRPQFREMVDRIKAGRYDAIIAWHPDRLARNMKEAGELIDLLDKGVIRDLKFKSFSFENTASGKMLLGMAFVLSKQYSDQLSDNVKRGNKRSIAEGKYINTAKHGYYKDAAQFHHPNGNNFVLIKQAFQMKLNGKTLNDIILYINSNSYQHLGKLYEMNKSRLSEILRDPFYTGVLIYGADSIVDLTDKCDFIPAVSVIDFLRINKISDLTKGFKVTSQLRSKKYTSADLLRGRVVCGVCNFPFSSGITYKYLKNGSKKGYYYYRCENKKCNFHNKSIRAKVIVDFVIQLIRKNKLATKHNYKIYLNQMNTVIKAKAQELTSEKSSVVQKLNIKRKSLDQVKQLLLNETDEKVKLAFKLDYKLTLQKIEELEIRLDAINNILNDSKSFIFSQKEFLELFQKMPDIIAQTRDMKLLDTILQNMFLNFTIKNKKVLDFQAKEPFNILLDHKKSAAFLKGRGSGTRTRGLTVPNGAR